MRLKCCEKNKIMNQSKNVSCITYVGCSIYIFLTPKCRIMRTQQKDPFFKLTLWCQLWEFGIAVSCNLFFELRKARLYKRRSHCIGPHCIGLLHRVFQRKLCIDFRFKTQFCQDSLFCKHISIIFKNILTSINVLLGTGTTYYDGTNKSQDFIVEYCTELYNTQPICIQFYGCTYVYQYIRR